jgi:hypothetical protein
VSAYKLLDTSIILDGISLSLFHSKLFNKNLKVGERVDCAVCGIGHLEQKNIFRIRCNRCECFWELHRP